MHSEPKTIERVFADAKELHGMRYAKHRGIPSENGTKPLICLHESQKIGK